LDCGKREAEEVRGEAGGGEGGDEVISYHSKLESVSF
jgi:hypothetical protein